MKKTIVCLTTILFLSAVLGLTGARAESKAAVHQAFVEKLKKGHHKKTSGPRHVSGTLIKTSSRLN